MGKQKGKFIVFEGQDGVGKTTQFNLLAEKLKAEGHRVETVDFPQYGTGAAFLVEKYLNGEYGSAEEVGPYRASIFYACDRYDASFKIREWLKEGAIVLSNRYIFSNMAHQGNKIVDGAERKKFFDWLLNLEYSIFEIPQPDLTIVLHLDAKIAQMLTKERGVRQYVKDREADIHEEDLLHLEKAEKVYLEIVRDYPGFKLIECARGKEIMSREEIHQLVCRELEEILKIT